MGMVIFLLTSFSSVWAAKDIVATSAVAVKIFPHRSLKVIVKNLGSPTAPIIIGVYGTKNKFPDPNDQLKQYKFKPNGTELNAKIKNLKYGIYALAVYQDVNRNGKIDKDFLGIPKEPYGFSDNYRPIVKAPDFNDCKFEYNAENNAITIVMIR